MVPATELIPKSPNGNSSRLALPSITAPARRIPAAIFESSRGRWSTSASEPPVVGRPRTSMLSLNAIGMPWNGLRKRPAARSASERPRFGDRPRIERQHRAKRRAVAIVHGQPLQVVAHDILGCRHAARQGILNLVRRFLDDRKRRLSSRAVGAGNVQLAICDRCSAVRPRRSGSATSLSRDRRSHARSPSRPAESSSRRASRRLRSTLSPRRSPAPSSAWASA